MNINTTPIVSLSAIVIAAGLFGGCATMEHADQFEDITKAVAVLHPTQGNNVRGTIYFERVTHKDTRVTGTITGLTPNGTHAIHVHEYGDCTAPDATSAGGHYNPQGHHHALPDEDTQRHAGDLGNLRADANGKATIDITVGTMTPAGVHHPVIGRAVIIHADSDKGLAKQPTGAAGGRIACGVIGVANPSIK